MRVEATDCLKIGRAIPNSISQALKYYGTDIALGGECIRKMIVGENVDTYDIYIKDTTTIMPEEIVDYLEEYEQFLPYKVKFIIKMFKYPWDLLNRMDFTTESAVLMYEEGEWQTHCHEKFYIDNTNRRLTSLSGGNGFSSLFKILDYIKKGYNITNKELSKVMAKVVVEISGEWEEGQEDLQNEIIDTLNTIKPDYE